MGGWARGKQSSHCYRYRCECCGKMRGVGGRKNRGAFVGIDTGPLCSVRWHQTMLQAALVGCLVL